MASKSPSPEKPTVALLGARRSGKSYELCRWALGREDRVIVVADETRARHIREMLLQLAKDETPFGLDKHQRAGIERKVVSFQRPDTLRSLRADIELAVDDLDDCLAYHFGRRVRFFTWGSDLARRFLSAPGDSLRHMRKVLN